MLEFEKPLVENTILINFIFITSGSDVPWAHSHPLSLPQIHADLRAGFKSGKLTPIAYRKYQLTQLAYLIKDNISRFEEALKKDIGRPILESRLWVLLLVYHFINFSSHFSIHFFPGHYSLELVPTISEILTQIKNVEKWSKPTRPPFNVNFFPMRPLIRKEPKGVVLIISPFNYPIFLTLGPAVCTFPGVTFKRTQLYPFSRRELSRLATQSPSKPPSPLLPRLPWWSN